jgi:hypothetical protein
MCEIFDPFVVESLLLGYRIPGASRGDRAEAAHVLLSRGLTAPEIAVMLDCTERTVERLKRIETQPMPEELPEWARDDDREWPLCPQGHEMTPDNILSRKYHSDVCRMCYNTEARARWKRAYDRSTREDVSA